MNLFFKLISYIFFRISLFRKKISKKYYTWQVKTMVKSFENPISINAKCIFTKNTTLGKNTNFNGLIIKGLGNVTIGNNFHSGEGCKFITSFHNYQGSKIPYDHSIISKDICIADQVWIGDDVIILGGVNIGEGAIIQAGSVVTSDIPPMSIAGGHPARVFSSRDKEHYMKLKSEGKFH